MSRINHSDLSQAGRPVSAVVVNFNGGRRLLSCLSALLSQRHSLAEILVVDNASTDETLRQVRRQFPSVRVIELEANVGLPAARNIGLSESSHPLVLILDHDLYPRPDCLEQLVRAWKDRQATVACPRILLSGRRVQADGADPHFVGTLRLRNGYQPVEQALSQAGEVSACLGGCMLVDRDEVLSIGGFEESYFFYFEDLEFSLKVRSRGLRITCEPAAIVFHDPGQGTPGLAFRGKENYPARRAYLTMRNRLTTLFLHYELRSLLVLAPVLALYELSSFLLVLRRGWHREWARAWLWQLRNRRWIRRRRMEIQSSRRLRDRDLLGGGPLPLAPGLLKSRSALAAVNVLSEVLTAYWRFARKCAM
jgi:GT2 family glycosyltransferase